MMIKLLITFLSAIYLVQSQTNCPDYETVPNFEAERYLGRWYEQMKFPQIFELNSKCAKAEYGLLPDGLVSVYNTNINEITGNMLSMNGTAEFIEGPTVAKLWVTFPSVGGEAPYWVLDTDYDTYALVWSCTDIETRVGSWILTREQIPQEGVVQSVFEYAQNLGINVTRFEVQDQVNCQVEF